jgi:hypothetical protein
MTPHAKKCVRGGIIVSPKKFLLYNYPPLTIGQIPLIIALTRAFINIFILVVRFYDLNRLSYMYRNTYTESLRLRLRDSYILYNIIYNGEVLPLIGQR